MRPLSNEELNAAALVLGDTLQAEELQGHPPGATMKLGAQRREAPPAATSDDPIASLPHVTISPPGSVGDAPRDLANTRDVELRVLRLLGSGGMGQVHLAEQRSLRREVAIKSTRPERAHDQGRRSLLYEAVITGGLEHPNIIPVHLLGRDDGGDPVMVMKRVEGVAWSDLIEKEAHPWWPKLLRAGRDRMDLHLDVLRQVCHALEFAHEAGVIHRDLKPANVMLGAFGEVYLLDWGLAARLDADGHAPASDMIGTPGFMAPEQVTAMAGPQGASTDVYLLGATLHNVLTGRYRHGGESLQQVLMAALSGGPVAYPATVSPDLAALCNRATALRADDRPASVREFRFALEDCVAHRGSMALCRAAGASLAVLLEALAQGDRQRADRDAVVRASAACRFGFTQSLAAWPGNGDARAGLQQCLDALFDDELSRDNLAGAEAAVAEMPDRAPDHDARLNALRERRDVEARRVASLQSAALELDKRASSTERTKTFATLGGLILVFNALSAYGLVRGRHPDHATLIWLAAAGVVVASTLAWRERRTAFHTAYNRTVNVSAVALVWALLLHRIAAAALNIPVPWVMTVDLMILTCVASVAALILVRWLAGAALVFGLGATLSVLFPSKAPVLFVAASTIGLTVSAVLALREGAVNLGAVKRPE